MPTRTLVALTDLSDWSAVVSGQARLEIAADLAPQGPAMRLDFDFHGGGGFVVARRPLRLTLPASFAIDLAVRADGLPNAFELKLVDPGGANVWRYRDESFDFQSDWRTLRIRDAQIDFGWGPLGGGPPREVGAIELVVAAGPGGRGRLWISDLRLEDCTPAEPPLVRASSSLAGHRAEFVLDGQADTNWRAERLPAWIELDFREPRDFGGLILNWDSPRPRDLQVLAGDDGTTWESLYAAPLSAGTRSFLYLPRGRSRLLRLRVDAPGSGPAPALVSVEVQPQSFSRSIAEFFHHLAQHAPRGHYPRWLYREQSYWTPVDVPDGAVPALFNEEGMTEIGRAGFSVEPFLRVAGRLLTWADGEVSQGLIQPPLPIPESIWRLGDLTLRITAFAARGPEGTLLYLGYRLANGGDRPSPVDLLVALRPFQVSPPWQGHREIGGMSAVRELAYRGGQVWVNGVPALLPLDEPAGFGAAAFDQGPITDYLAAGALPEAAEIADGFGYASGALRFALVLAPGGWREVNLALPLGSVGPRPLALDLAAIRPAERLAFALGQWSALLGAVEVRLPSVAREAWDACRGALAHILINRDGPALQPGPRRYTRSWIRDGAVMAAALLRMGRPEAAADFIRWYAGFQRADGNVPCCVDREGPDWLPEHDSHGQLIFAVADHYRFTGDRRLVEDLWPAVLKALSYLEGLRAQRLTDAYRDGERRACYGLLPESVSHEGYLAHPVHSYWDDLWALRGLKDAVELARVMEDDAAARRLARLRDDFRASLHGSIRDTMASRGIDFIPGSVEWADPDPSAVANALTLIDESHRLPPAALRRTFDLYMERFRAMHGDHPVPWTNYTPYEIRIIGALVRLGRRDEAQELLRFFLAERRPRAWNQWPEIAWADPRAPGHQGDLPHAWIGAEYCLAFRDLFVYEREADRSLVVAAGIPDDWLDEGGVSASGLRTCYGTLSLGLRRLGDGAVEALVDGDLSLPPGGIRLAPPLPGPVLEVAINGRPSPDFSANEVQVRSIPAQVSVIC